MKSLTATCTAVALMASAAIAAAQSPSRASARYERGRLIAADQPLAALTLVRSAGDRAVVRFNPGALEIVARGDRLGATQAEVVEAATGRLVLAEKGRTADGRPNRTLIVLRDGETGGTRYQEQPDERGRIAMRPVVVGSRKR